ncbi:unnamed protein product [Symbiodinium sp. CCMP2456]|nr:unnamed protein product [Symbiodinium sp. CCMP2456]
MMSKKMSLTPLPAEKFPEFNGYAVFMNEHLARLPESALTEAPLSLRCKWDGFTDSEKKAYEDRVPTGPVVRVRAAAPSRRLWQAISEGCKRQKVSDTRKATGVCGGA